MRLTTESIGPSPEKAEDTRISTIAERRHATKALRALTEYSNILFDRAPVPMHSIDRGGKLVMINRRWSQTLGYEWKEVAGRMPTEFLTDTSHPRMVQEVLPLFWRAGSCRSVGVKFKGRDGCLLNLALDAEVLTAPGGQSLGYAALYNGDDLKQSQEASATIKALQELNRVQCRFEDILSVAGSRGQGPHTPREHPSSDQLVEASVANEALGAAIELVQDISTSLGAAPRVQEEWLSAMAEQQHEMLQVAKGIERILADMADTLAAFPSNTG